MKLCKFLQLWHRLKAHSPSQNRSVYIIASQTHKHSFQTNLFRSFVQLYQWLRSLKRIQRRALGLTSMLHNQFNTVEASFFKSKHRCGLRSSFKLWFQRILRPSELRMNPPAFSYRTTLHRCVSWTEIHRSLITIIKCRICLSSPAQGT